MNNPIIITKRNTDSEGNPISVSLIETRQIFDGPFIVLRQAPDELYRVNNHKMTRRKCKKYKRRRMIKSCTISEENKE